MAGSNLSATTADFFRRTPTGEVTRVLEAECQLVAQTTHVQPVGIAANVVAPVHRPIPMPTTATPRRRRTTVRFRARRGVICVLLRVCVCQVTPVAARGVPAVAPWLVNVDTSLTLRSQVRDHN